jgi:glutathione S-transferase
MTLKIYGIARSRAIRTFWAAYELGIAFEQIDVAPGEDGSRKAEFMALNPNGHVPFIVDDGVMIWESMAINLYLARKHGGPTAPQTLAEEGQMMAWTAWALTELEPHAAQAMYHASMLPEPERIASKVTEALAAVAAPLAVFEAHLAANGGYAVGGRFTMADLNLYGAAFYLRFTPQALEGKPAIANWMATCRARPAAKRAFALRGE